jgi:hypothetical protein
MENLPDTISRRIFLPRAGSDYSRFNIALIALSFLLLAISAASTP